jgi:hypothetical protein
MGGSVVSLSCKRPRVDQASERARPNEQAPTAARLEALRVLTDHAERDGAKLLAEPLARRALAVTVGGDFAVSLDALEALLRRLDSARNGDLVVKRASADRYRVSRRGRADHSYDVWIGDAASLEGSCSCLDFGKASLGICKHVLAALEKHGRRGSSTSRPALRWDPVRPLTGPGDYVARIWFDRRSTGSEKARQLFQLAAVGSPIDPARITDPVVRLASIEQLVAAIRRQPAIAEPALLPLLERERATLRRGGSLGKRELDRVLRGLKRKLFPYQREGVARFLSAGRLLLADDMGLGKTAQAIGASHALFTTGAIRRILVVVPAPLKPQWEREWRAFTEIPIRSVDGHPEERARIYERCEAGALVVNYEQLLRDLPLVQAYAPDLVILDEAQRIKNWQTKTAAVVKRIEAPWRLVLTGTPMENRLDELSSIMEWVDEHALEPRWRLANWHAIRADGGREVIGARNLETLRDRVAPRMLRRLRRDVLGQLPPRRDVRVSVPLTDAQQAAHSDLDHPIAQLARRAKRRPLTQAEFLKLMKLLTQQRMICNALALRDFDAIWPTLEQSRRRTAALDAVLGSPKLVELRDRIEDLVVTQERKVVIFSQWRRMLQLAAWACGDIFERAGVRAMFFSGQESQRRRSENIVAFHDDPDARVLFATDAGGVGLNLQRAANCCINLELPWNPAVLEQRIGRIYRLGQEQPVDVYNLVAETGIEARIARIVGDKRALFTGLFDGTSDEVPFDSAGSFLTRLHEVVQPREPVEPTDADEAPETFELEAPEPPPQETPEPEPSDPGRLFPGGEPGRITLDIADLAATLAQVAIRPLDDGRIALELPKPAATALGALLRAVAAAVDRVPPVSPG